MKTVNPSNLDKSKEKIVSGRYLIPDWPAPKAVKAFTSLKAMSENRGESKGDFCSFNMAMHVGDSVTAVNKNRESMQKYWRFASPPAWLRQVHGSSVVNAKNVQHGDLPTADGSWTDEYGLPCVVMTADCLPIVFCNTQGSRVAAIHAGWRGLASGIIKKAVEAMEVSAKEIMVWLGPAICQKHFEVGPEVRNIFVCQQDFLVDAFFPGNGDRWHANLYQIASLQLEALGVHYIYGGNHCAFSEKKLFYSHRREQSTGRMATAVWLCR